MRRRVGSSRRRRQNFAASAGDHREELSRRDIQDLHDLGSNLIDEFENNFEPNRESSEFQQVQSLPEAPLRSESRRRFEAALQSFQVSESVSAPPSPVERNRSVLEYSG